MTLKHGLNEMAMACKIVRGFYDNITFEPI